MVYPGSGPGTPTPGKAVPRNISEVTGGDASINRKNSKDEENEHEDTLSVLSTSSRSIRFSGSKSGSGSGSWRGKILPISSGPTTDSGRKGSGAGSTSRSRRASNATSEDDAASLGIQVGLALQDAGKETGSWGVGDEVRMGLE